MADSRYRRSGRRSPPLYNPARNSMPVMPSGYHSLFGGDIHVEPTSRQYDYYASSVTPVTTTTYAVRKDPVPRPPLRGHSLRRRMSTTADSTSKRPIIVTTKVATSSTSSGSNAGPRSPSRDTSRSNEDGGPAYYTQPASSIKRTRVSTHALPPPNEDEVADDRLLLLGPRSSDKHYHQRGVRPPPFYNGPTQPHRHESSEYGDHGYEYTKPSDLARYDLDHHRPRRPPARRESFDKHYYPEKGVCEMPDRRLRGPPPTTWGLQKINANVRPPSTGPGPGLRMPPAPDPIRRSDSALAGPLVLVDSPASTPRRGPSRTRDGPGRPVYRDDHYRSHDESAGNSRDRESRDRESRDRESRDRGSRERGPRERERERRDHEPRDRDPRELKDREYFHDDKVPSRGFGLRVEPNQDDYRRGGESRHRDERRERRYHDDREPKRRSDSDQDFGPRREHDDRDRRHVRDSRVDDDGERERRRAERRDDISPPQEKERDKEKDDRDGKKDSLKDTLATGLGLAAASLGLGSAFKGSDKDNREREKEKDKEREKERERAREREREREREKEKTKDRNDEKYDKQPARRRQEDDAGRRDNPVDDEKRTSRREDADLDRDRSRRERARSDAGFDRSPDKYLLVDDGMANRRRPGRPAVTPFDPNDTAGLMALKEKLATTEEPEKEKVRVNQRDPAPASVAASVAAPAPVPVPVKEKERARPRAGSMPLAPRSLSPERKTSPLRNPVEVSSEPAASSTVLGLRAEDSSSPLPSASSPRGRELMPTGDSEKERQVRVVSPPRSDKDGDKDLDEPPRPIKGILKQPTSRFPEDQNPLREGVAPHKDDPKAKSGVPSGARWTKINRRMVNPEALTLGKERFEVRDDFVIVLRVLSKEEIQAYAAVTAELRERRKKEFERKDKDDEDDEDRKRDGQWQRQRERDEERDQNDERDRRDRDRDRDRDRGDRGDRDRDRDREKGKEKEKEKEKEKDRDRDRERERDRDRDRDRDRERDKDRDRERERERDRESDRERGSRRYRRYGSDEDDDGYYEPRSGYHRDRRDRGHDRDPRDAMGGSE